MTFFLYDIRCIPSSPKLACIICQIDILCIFIGHSWCTKRKHVIYQGCGVLYAIDGSIFHASAGLKIPADRSDCQQ